MATRFEIALPPGTPFAVDAASAALDLIEEIEERLTVYRDTGAVAHVNREAADANVPVDSELYAFLERCAALTVETAEAFDAGIGALIELWRIARDRGELPTEEELNRTAAESGFRHVSLNTGTVRFRRQGLKLNFGAIGKGYALDRAAELLRRDWGIGSALLQGGGSSILGMGVPPNEPRGWPISVNHPEPDQRPLAAVYLKDRALGTSAATFQYFEIAGKRYGHVLDPRSGRPAVGCASASCLHASAAAADALSTAFFVAGSDWTREFLRSRPEIAGLILNNGLVEVIGE